MNVPIIPEKRFFVYALSSSDPKHKKKIYIGKTYDPTRRLWQHLGGTKKGGAKYTSKYGNGLWNRVLLIEGFKSEREALVFEWAVQHPQKSVRFRGCPKELSFKRELKKRIPLILWLLSQEDWVHLNIVENFLELD